MVGLSSQILWLSLLLINLVSNVLGCDFPIGRWTNVNEWNGPGHTNCKVQTWDGKVMYNKNITKEEIAWGIQDLSRTTECVYTNADATVLCMFEHFAFPALGELPTKPVFFNYFATQTPNGVAIRFVSGSSTIIGRTGPREHHCSNRYKGKPPVEDATQVLHIPPGIKILNSPPLAQGTSDAT